MEQRISGFEGMIEEMDLLIRENIKSKNFLNHIIQETGNTMTCQNKKSRKIGIKKEYQLKDQ